MSTTLWVYNIFMTSYIILTHDDQIEVTEQLAKFGSSVHGLTVLGTVQSGRPKHEHENSRFKKGEGRSHSGPFSRPC